MLIETAKVMYKKRKEKLEEEIVKCKSEKAKAELMAELYRTRHIIKELDKIQERTVEMEK